MGQGSGGGRRASPFDTSVGAIHVIGPSAKSASSLAAYFGHD